MEQQAMGPAPTNQALTESYPDKIFGINIRSVDRGYIVEVGCKTFAMSDTAELIDYLGMYLNKPAETHLKYYSGELFKKTA